MKRTALRIIAILLVISVLTGTFGCGTVKNPSSESAPEKTQGVSTFGIAGAASSAPEATAIPAPSPALSATERFQALDAAFFRDYVTDDGYTFHQMVTEPARFSIDPASVPMTLGDFSEEANQKKCEEYAFYLEQLQAIPREELSEREQMTYDVLQQYLERTIADGQYAYFFEPLTGGGVGLQSNLPLALALYELRNEEDVKNYLLLLGDVPRYYGQIMVYEQQRAEKGLFMTETALNSVLKDLNDFISAGDGLFLVNTFHDAVSKIDALSPAQIKEYTAQNQALLKTAFLPSCEMLRDGLEALRTSCRASEGLYAEGNKGLSYFELRMQAEADTLLSADEALELLETTLNRLTVASSYIYMENPSVIRQEITVTTGDTASDLAYLKPLSESVLGKLPEHTITLSAVPKELETQMSAAAFVIPAIDGAADNTVLVNSAYSGKTPLFTAAHETYFGHLYQYVLQRGNGELGLSQRVLSFNGLSEGWAQAGTELMIGAQTKFDADYCKLTYYNSLVTNSILPAIVSILINYKAYDAEQITQYLAQFGYSDPKYTTVYTQWAIDMPFYTFSYALGYSAFSDMLLSAEGELGDAFDRSAFLEKLMDLGPAPFNLLQERMDVWTDEQVAE